MKKSSIVRDTAEIFVERKEESSNLKGLLDHFSNLKNLIKIPPLCNCAAQAAEIFVERRYRTSHHNNILGTRNAEKIFLLGTHHAETRAGKKMICQETTVPLYCSS